jgi:hypothetical protein
LTERLADPVVELLALGHFLFDLFEVPIQVLDLVVELLVVGLDIVDDLAELCLTLLVFGLDRPTNLLDEELFHVGLVVGPVPYTVSTVSPVSSSRSNSTRWSWYAVQFSLS